MGISLQSGVIPKHSLRIRRNQIYRTIVKRTNMRIKRCFKCQLTKASDKSIPFKIWTHPYRFAWTGFTLLCLLCTVGCKPKPERSEESQTPENSSQNSRNSVFSHSAAPSDELVALRQKIREDSIWEVTDSNFWFPFPAVDQSGELSPN